ncbi:MULTISPECIES: (d)CMP kinase [Candidatus Ichthyocystis]|uniref:(d)CMP kinase n=1 Tax=Candidatus Ichthyocystis TaxID=2929841 RepID=UPI000B17CFCF|nr:MULTISPECIES: (d)CMP kinase [Ichthyocystis]
MGIHDSIPVIAIDGPSASGKGAVSKKVSNTLGFHYLESGLLYRAAAFVAINNNLPLEGNLVSEFISKQKISWSEDGSILVNGNICTRLYDPEVSLAASRVSRIPSVRKFLMRLQMDRLREPGLVADGRDMGTVVFPNAILKVFLTATAEVRAKRRFLQLKQHNSCVRINEVLREILLRDSYDSTREYSSLVAAENAVIIDSTDQSLDCVVDEVLFHASQRIYNL